MSCRPIAYSCKLKTKQKIKNSLPRCNYQTLCVCIIRQGIFTSSLLCTCLFQNTTLPCCRARVLRRGSLLNVCVSDQKTCSPFYLRFVWRLITCSRRPGRPSPLLFISFSPRGFNKRVLRHVMSVAGDSKELLKGLVVQHLAEFRNARTIAAGFN